MDWNERTATARRDASKTANEALDAAVLKATQLESLLVMLAHAVRLDGLPAYHCEAVCILGANLAREIGSECCKLAGLPL